VVIFASLLPPLLAVRVRAASEVGVILAGKSAKSCPHAGQTDRFIGLYVSHCPQAIPISNSIFQTEARGTKIAPRLAIFQVGDKPRRLRQVRQGPPPYCSRSLREC
jgi:hypothetical protein